MWKFLLANPLKPHLLALVAAAFFIAVIVVSDDSRLRLLYFVPFFIFFVSAFILFAYEYNRIGMLAWRDHSEKIAMQKEHEAKNKVSEWLCGHCVHFKLCKRS